MNTATPHYQLLLEASRNRGSGRWRFVLRATDGSIPFEVADVEPKVRGERLDLLTVVRGLEALDQPSRVTLMGCSRYVRCGVQYGLPEWRSNGWRWEYFGQMVPVKNGDLWQRLDRALRFHEVECSYRRFDAPHGPAATAAPPATEKTRQGIGDLGVRVAARHWVKFQPELLCSRLVRRIAVLLRLWRCRLARGLARTALGRAAGLEPPYAVSAGTAPSGAPAVLPWPSGPNYLTHSARQREGVGSDPSQQPNPTGSCPAARPGAAS